MARRSRRGLDPDDWFAEPDPSNSARRGAAFEPSLGTRPAADQQNAGPEDWLTQELPARRRRRNGAAASPLNARAAWLAGGAIVLLLIVLAAAGVFSGGSTRHRTATRPARTASTTVPQPARAAVRAPPTTLSPGARGAAVRTLQRALARLGYAPGTIDGQYGPATQAAVARFQQASGLTTDGIFGLQTRAALVTALKRDS